jgi:hypothetical protein
MLVTVASHDFCTDSVISLSVSVTGDCRVQVIIIVFESDSILWSLQQGTVKLSEVLKEQLTTTL